jgi:ferredoxin
VPVSHLFSTSPPKRDSVALNLRLLLNADIYRTACPCQSSTKRLINGNAQQTVYQSTKRLINGNAQQTVYQSTKRLINGNAQQTVYHCLSYDPLFSFSSVCLPACLSVCPSVHLSVIPQEEYQKHMDDFCSKLQLDLQSTFSRIDAELVPVTLNR